MKPAVILFYLGLLGAGIPWYWPDGSGSIWLGAPAWVVTAVIASAAASLLTAFVLRHPWPGESQDENEHLSTSIDESRDSS